MNGNVHGIRIIFNNHLVGCRPFRLAYCFYYCIFFLSLHSKPEPIYCFFFKEFPSWKRKQQQPYGQINGTNVLKTGIKPQTTAYISVGKSTRKNEKIHASESAEVFSPGSEHCLFRLASLTNGF